LPWGGLLIFFNTRAAKRSSPGRAFCLRISGHRAGAVRDHCRLGDPLDETALDEISPRYEAVARSLGSSAWQAFWRITFPWLFAG